jgi:hypothetical protein
MRGSHFCYYHSRNRSRARLDAMEDLVIPIPEDTASIRTSIAQTLNALISKRTDAKTDGLVLYGLQLAVQSIPKGFSLPPETVREVTQSADGDELAPAACLNDISDCSGCPQADTCERREIDPEEGDEGDEDEQDGDETGFSLTPAVAQKLLQTFAGLQRGG